MINKKLLNQVLRFERTQPVFSIIRDLNESIIKYQNENNIHFFDAKRGQKASVTNEKAFFEFVSSELLQGKLVHTYEDIKKIVYADTRASNIKESGDSKTNFIRVFDNVVVVKKSGEVAQLFQEKDLASLSSIDGFVAVENGESFLNIDASASSFSYNYFIYLSGYANKLTRKFLRDKKVEFFCDFDIEGMNIYESFECSTKSFFLPEDLESYFQKYPNTELYKKQIKNLKARYDGKLEPLKRLIQQHNTVVEQEVYR